MTDAAAQPKLINNPKDAVDEMIEGMLLTNPSLVRLAGHRVLLRRDFATAVRDANRVAIVSGGGSGHEPAHAGFVGRGMLTAAVLGDFFASPPPSAVLAAIRAVCGPAGCLLVVKNFAGDRVNFESAASLARSEGLAVSVVVAADDCATDVPEHQRRGLAGTLLVHKAAGAAAEAGRSLDEVRAAALSVLCARSAGVALGGCSIPGQARAFELRAGEAELGVGIHGEKGARRAALQPADAVVAWACERIAADDAGVAQRGARVVALVNGLGGTSAPELSICARAVVAWLRARGADVEGVAAGNLMTAIEMHGISVTLARVDDASLALLREPTEAPAWIALRRPSEAAQTVVDVPWAREQGACAEAEAAADPHALQVVEKVMRAVVTAEHALTQLDREVGDGDMGVTARAAAERILERSRTVARPTLAQSLKSLAGVVQNVYGGTAGGLVGVLLARMAADLSKCAEPCSPAAVAHALSDGVASVMDVGRGKTGEKTMLDALVPAAEAMTQAAAQGAGMHEALARAAQAAAEGAKKTREMVGVRGRAAYLGERAKGFEDPGAVLVGIVLQTLAEPNVN
eukprot:m51a1_g10062 putative dihydroxyacetone kinase (576) ;mRNA; r:81179-83070